MAVKIVTYFCDVEFNMLNHDKEYDVIKSASSYEDCFTCAISSGADIIMQITHPVYRIQDLFNTFENYASLPTILAFYVLSEDTIVYAISNQGKYQSGPRQLFLRFFRQNYTHIIDYSFYCKLPEELSRGILASRVMVLEKSEYLEDILRGVSRQEFQHFRNEMGLKLGDSGYYLYVWFLRDVQGNDYFHHSNIKNLYDLVGDLLKYECETVLAQYNSGEVFYTTPRMLCIIINDPEPGRGGERGRSPRLNSLTEALNSALGCGDANRCMSGYVKNIEQLRDAFDSLYVLKQYSFFYRDTVLLTEDFVRATRNKPDIAEVHRILKEIRHLITYDIGNPNMQSLVQTLFLGMVKPSLDYELFFYCYFNLSSFLYQKITNQFESVPDYWMETHIDIQRSNIEIKYGNILSAIGVVQSSSSKYMSHVKNPLVEKAIKYIHKHYADNITLITLSRHLNISSVYLSQLFKKELGISPIKFIISYRIEKAKELLRESDDTVYNIAVKVGFLESKHFSKTFKHITGLTPMQYKKNN